MLNFSSMVSIFKSEEVRNWRELPRLNQKTITAKVLIQEQETVFRYLPKEELEGLQIRHYYLRADEPASCNEIVIKK